MAWLEEIGEAVERAVADERQSAADKQARQQSLDSEFQENRNHLAHVVAPVLKEAAEKITSTGKEARVISPGSMDAALGDTTRYALVVESDRVKNELEFSVNKTGDGIQVRKPGGMVDRCARSELTTEAIRETVVDFVKGALSRH
jgi:hypothetical protein